MSELDDLLGEVDAEAEAEQAARYPGADAALRERLTFYERWVGRMFGGAHPPVDQWPSVADQIEAERYLTTVDPDRWITCIPWGEASDAPGDTRVDAESPWTGGLDLRNVPDPEPRTWEGFDWDKLRAGLEGMTGCSMPACLLFEGPTCLDNWPLEPVALTQRKVDAETVNVERLVTPPDDEKPDDHTPREPRGRKAKDGGSIEDGIARGMASVLYPPPARGAARILEHIAMGGGRFRR
ncbi:MAG: hypothetical protein CMN30_27720 [Sandaracinus sp.]|nr:hypothetical protein [Sandaracinus sp.]